MFSYYKRQLDRRSSGSCQVNKAYQRRRECTKSELMSVRILVVDDYQVARKTIRSLLNWHSMHVCGEAENGKQAVEKVKELNPDLVLLDINMPVMNGIQAAYEIRRIAPSTKVIFLTIHDAPETAAVMGLLADEFVPKSAVGTTLIPMVKRLLQHQAETTRD